MKNSFLHYLAGICLICCLGAGAAFAALPEGATPLTYIVGNKGARMYLDTEWTLQPDKDVFEAVVEIGYLFGMANNWIEGMDYVMAFYVFDFCLVATDMALWFRNRRLDEMGVT